MRVIVAYHASFASMLTPESANDVVNLLEVAVVKKCLQNRCGRPKNSHADPMFILGEPVAGLSLAL